MSLEWGVYRQKPYGWQVWRQREPHSPVPERGSRYRVHAVVRQPGGRESSAAVFPPRTGLGLPAEIA